MKTLLFIFILSIFVFGQDYQPNTVKQYSKRIATNPKTVYVVKTDNKIYAVCSSYRQANEWIDKQQKDEIYLYANWTRTDLLKLYPNTKKGNASLAEAIKGLGC